MRNSIFIIESFKTLHEKGKKVPHSFLTSHKHCLLSVTLFLYLWSKETSLRSCLIKYLSTYFPGSRLSAVPATYAEGQFGTF